MRPEDIKNKKILFSALNWGMGHVSRSISIIQQLVQQGNQLFIACSENQKIIFKCYFPDLKYINHEEYPFKFKGKGNFEIDLALNFYSLFKRLKSEKIEVEKMIEDHQIDIIISDHRYGFHSTSLQSIFITHQINLPVNWILNWVDGIHKKLIKKFSTIWLLDTCESTFAGKLSRSKNKKNVKYIGIHSRFSLYPLEEKSISKIVIVSGPEPYANQFFLSQLEKAKKTDAKIIFIIPSNEYHLSNSKNITIISSSDWKKCDELILKAKKIVSRAGYSTIMDIEMLQTKSELNPTKGQKEQEYLFEMRKRLPH
jgi:UDP-N-acetylglucosamine:LPS N-acetylglucosamine transferase